MDRLILMHPDSQFHSCPPRQLAIEEPAVSRRSTVHRARSRWLRSGIQKSSDALRTFSLRHAVKHGPPANFSLKITRSQPGVPQSCRHPGLPWSQPGVDPYVTFSLAEPKELPALVCERIRGVLTESDSPTVTFVRRSVPSWFLRGVSLTSMWCWRLNVAHGIEVGDVPSGGRLPGLGYVGTATALVHLRDNGFFDK